MRKFYLFFAVLMASLFVFSNNAAESPQYQTQRASSVGPLDRTVMTLDGLGPVKLNLKFSQLPATSEGLYNKMTVTTGEDEIYAEFTFNGETMFTACGDETGEIYKIYVENPKIKAKVAGYLVAIGDPVAKVKKISGVKADPDGYGYFIYQDLNILEENGAISGFILGDAFD